VAKISAQSVLRLAAKETVFRLLSPERFVQDRPNNELLPKDSL